MPAPKGNDYAKGNPGGGRPTEYKPHYPQLAYKYCLLGATDAQLAELFEVCETTINAWKNEHQEFCEALIDGKVKADANVAHKLYDKAMGAEWIEEQAFKVKRVFYDDNGKKNETEEVVIVPVKRAAPPDTPAISLWLRNRQGIKWKDNQNVEVAHTGTIMHFAADVPRLCGLITQLASRRADIELPGDVPSRPILLAEVRTE